jgi:hypothetical protein
MRAVEIEPIRDVHDLDPVRAQLVERGEGVGDPDRVRRSSRKRYERQPRSRPARAAAHARPAPDARIS